MMGAKLSCPKALSKIEVFHIHIFQPNLLYEKASAAIYNEAQPLYKANEHLKKGVCISTWSKKLPLYQLFLGAGQIPLVRNHAYTSLLSRHRRIRLFLY